MSRVFKGGLSRSWLDLPVVELTLRVDVRKRVVLAGCTSGGAGFRMIVCLKRSLSWMG
jgi:hypothetical protein